MKRLALLTAAAALAFAPTTASAAIIVYTADLTGAAENPPVVTDGTGFGIVTVDDVANTMRVQIFFSGLTGPTTASHIHCCVPPTENAGVATQVPTFAGFPLGVTSGSYDQTFDMALAGSFGSGFITANGGTVDGARMGLFNGLSAGLAYLNVHSSFAPGGEIRGQLTAVPEPGTWMLMLGGFAMAGWSLRRQRTRRAAAT